MEAGEARSFRRSLVGAAGHEGRDGSLWKRRLLGRKEQKPESRFSRLDAEDSCCGRPAHPRPRPRKWRQGFLNKMALWKGVRPGRETRLKKQMWGRVPWRGQALAQHVAYAGSSLEFSLWDLRSMAKPRSINGEGP